MAKLVFYWYWPHCDTYCKSSRSRGEGWDTFDDVWRLSNYGQAGFLATVVE
jgi:hypothetical protein